MLINLKFVICRVMTVSFHKYGDMFFPGTGDVKVPPPLVLGIFLFSVHPDEKIMLVYKLLLVNFVT